MPLKYFAYLRKSSEAKERQALSIDAQQNKLQERFRDLDIEFVIEERSAFKPFNRPAFTSMLKRIEAGERQGLIAWHPDRLSRNEIDASPITYMLRTGALQDLRFATYSFENTPEGIWMLQIALSQSQYESAKKGRDVKRGLEAKAKLGYPPYRAIIGYQSTLDARGIKRWKKDPERFPLVRKLFELLLSGEKSVDEILQIARDEWGLTTPRYKSFGGGLIVRSRLYTLFRDPVYAGRFAYPRDSDVWHEGAYPAVVSEDEFERVQEILSSKEHKSVAAAVAVFPYRRTFRCGTCDASVTAERKKRATCPTCKHRFSALHRDTCPKCAVAVDHDRVDQYVYYRCTHRRQHVVCTEPAVEERAINKQVLQLASSFRISPAFASWATRKLDAKDPRDEERTRAAVSKLKATAEGHEKRLQRLLDLRVAGEIDEQEYRREKARTRKLIAQTKKRQSVITATDATHDAKLRSLIDLAENSAQRIKTDKIGNMRTFIQAIAAEGSKQSISAKKLSISLIPELVCMQEVASTERRLLSVFETRKRRLTERQIHRIYDASPEMLAHWDAIRTMF